MRSTPLSLPRQPCKQKAAFGRPFSVLWYGLPEGVRRHGNAPNGHSKPERTHLYAPLDKPGVWYSAHAIGHLASRTPGSWFARQLADEPWVLGPPAESRRSVPSATRLFGQHTFKAGFASSFRDYSKKHAKSEDFYAYKTVMFKSTPFDLALCECCIARRVKTAPKSSDFACFLE